MRQGHYHTPAAIQIWISNVPSFLSAVAIWLLIDIHTKVVFVDGGWRDLTGTWLDLLHFFLHLNRSSKYASKHATTPSSGHFTQWATITQVNSLPAWTDPAERWMMKLWSPVAEHSKFKCSEISLAQNCLRIPTPIMINAETIWISRPHSHRHHSHQPPIPIYFQS